MLIQENPVLYKEYKDRVYSYEELSALTEFYSHFHISLNIGMVIKIILIQYLKTAGNYHRKSFFPIKILFPINLFKSQQKIFLRTEIWI